MTRSALQKAVQAEKDNNTQTSTVKAVHARMLANLVTGAQTDYPETLVCDHDRIAKAQRDVDSLIICAVSLMVATGYTAVLRDNKGMPRLSIYVNAKTLNG